MKESVGSLRAFFVVVGLLGTLGGCMGMLGALALLALKPLWGVTLGACTVINLGLSLAYVYCGAQLPQLLRTNVNLVLKILYLSLAMNGVGIVVTLLLGLLSASSILTTLISVLISFYLINSVKRLSQLPGEEGAGVGFNRFEG